MTAVSTATPTNLNFYQPDRDSYAVAFQISPVLGEDITAMQTECQIDVTPNFNSINLQDYNETSPQILNFQNGYFYKSYTFIRRDLFETVTYYARVRVNSSSYLSSWSTPISFTLTVAQWIADAKLLQGLIPTKDTYCKEGLTLSSKILESYAREIQKLKNEITQVSNNINYYLCQDNDLYDVLGTLLQITRDPSRPFIEYRMQLLAFWNAYLIAGAVGAIQAVTQAVLGVPATFLYVRDTWGWIVHDSQTPYVAGSMPNQDPNAQFFVSDGVTYTDLLPTPCPSSKYANGLGVIIRIWNAFSLPTNHVLLESLIRKMIPVNVTPHIQYYMWQEGDFGQGSFGGGSFGEGSGYVQYFPND